MELKQTERILLTDQTLDNLLVRLAKEHTMFPRLRAEADNQYQPNNPMLEYLFKHYGFSQVLNEDLTAFLYELQDSWSATSRKGKLGIQRKIKARDQLNKEIAEFEAKLKRRVIAVKVEEKSA